jgi:hypothetical protein
MLTRGLHTSLPPSLFSLTSSISLSRSLSLTLPRSLPRSLPLLSCFLSLSSLPLALSYLTLSILSDAGRRCSTRCLRSHWTTNSAMGLATTSRARFRPWWHRPTSSFRTGMLSASRCSVVAHARSPCCTPAPHSHARVFGAECARPAVPAW